MHFPSTFLLTQVFFIFALLLQFSHFEGGEVAGDLLATGAKNLITPLEVKDTFNPQYTFYIR